eukprot:ANDGO_01390.mRNA.1 hypothetical protein
MKMIRHLVLLSAIFLAFFGPAALVHAKRAFDSKALHLRYEAFMTAAEDNAVADPQTFMPSDDADACCMFGGCGFAARDGTCVANNVCQCNLGSSGYDCLSKGVVAPGYFYCYEDPHCQAILTAIVFSLDFSGNVYLLLSPQFALVARVAPWCGHVGAINGLRIDHYSGSGLACEATSPSALTCYGRDGTSKVLTSALLTDLDVFSQGPISVIAYAGAFEIRISGVGVLELHIDAPCGSSYYISFAGVISPKLFGTLQGGVGWYGEIPVRYGSNNLIYSASQPAADPSSVVPLWEHYRVSTDIKDFSVLLTSTIPADWAIPDSNICPDSSSALALSDQSCFRTFLNQTSFGASFTVMSNDSHVVSIGDAIAGDEIAFIPSRQCAPDNGTSASFVAPFGNATLNFLCSPSTKTLTVEVVDSVAVTIFPQEQSPLSCAQSPRCVIRNPANRLSLASCTACCDVVHDDAFCSFCLRNTNPEDIPNGQCPLSVSTGSFVPIPALSDIIIGDYSYRISTTFSMAASNGTQNFMGDDQLLLSLRPTPQFPTCDTHICALYDYGWNCSQRCLCNQTNTDHCVDGRYGNGTCVCRTEWRGSSCNVQCPNCVFGKCVYSDAFSTASCSCDSFSFGPNQQLCQCTVRDSLQITNGTCRGPENPTDAGDIVSVVVPFLSSCPGAYWPLWTQACGTASYQVLPCITPATLQAFQVSLPNSIAETNQVILNVNRSSTAVPVVITVDVGSLPQQIVTSAISSLPLCQQSTEVYPLKLNAVVDGKYHVSYNMPGSPVLRSGFEARWHAEVLGPQGISIVPIAEGHREGHPASVSFSLPSAVAKDAASVKVVWTVFNVNDQKEYFGTLTLPVVRSSESGSLRFAVWDKWVCFVFVLSLLL